MEESPRVVALAGGVGAARFLRGLVKVCDPQRLTIIGNTGDDRSFYGVHVSPDLDIVTYTLAGAVDSERGFGLAGDTFSVIDSLGRFGRDNWFRLGDRDFATCLHRTLRFEEGDTLSEVTDEIRRSFGIQARILPMSDDACPTFVTLQDGRRIHFEDYLVRDGAPENVAGVALDEAGAATPGPDVLRSLREADVILLCPSNPVVSIGPILALPGVRDVLRKSGVPKVAVSPIVGGAPVKGPADRLMRAVGAEVSSAGVAGLYADFAAGLVIDERDNDEVPAVHALGYETAVLDTLMVNQARSEAVASAALDLARTLA